MKVADLDATACAELVRSGEASPRELVDLAIARIEKHDPELGAVIIPLFEQARGDADIPGDDGTLSEQSGKPQRPRGWDSEDQQTGFRAPSRIIARPIAR
jgi:hypothetical protein